jgi:hypothetical protein
MTEERKPFPETQFLYALIKEYYIGSKGKKIDTELRIVYWPEDYHCSGHEAQFVIYGKRPRCKTTGEYTPYRLKCHTVDQVIDFVRTIICPSNNMEVELHQFSGYNDDSKDEYNVHWFNTAENFATELVAYDVESRTTATGSSYLEFSATLSNILNILVNCDTV